MTNSQFPKMIASMLCAAAAYVAVQQTPYASQFFNPSSLIKLVALVVAKSWNELKIQ